MPSTKVVYETTNQAVQSNIGNVKTGSYLTSQAVK